MSEQASSQPVPQRQLVIHAALRSDVGLVRSENQDFGTYTTVEEEQESHPGGRLLIVADGMGGHRGGATASRLAAETVKAQYLGSETADIPTALRESLIRANARIYSEAQSNPDLRGMGTTTSVLAVRGNLGWLAHVGDSRIYLVRHGEIRQLTDDHSLVATMVREGLLTSAEAETHPRRNVLQRSMGVAEDVEVDVRGPIELLPGDTFILCSDGLHGLVKEPELKEIAQKSIDAAADEFLRKALERGAPDNVTVIVARVEDVGSGDATLVDRLEETHRLDPLDETVRDTHPLPVVEEDIIDTQPMPVLEPEDLEHTEEMVVPAESAATVERPAPPAPDELEAEPLEKTEEIVIPAHLGGDPATVKTEEVVVPPVSELAAAAAPVSAGNAPATAPAAPAPGAAAPTPQASASAKAPAASAPKPAAPQAKPSSSVTKWVLLIALALGAMGAWYYWSHQQAMARSSRTDTTVR